MGVQDEVEPILAQIRVEAEDRYSHFVASDGSGPSGVYDWVAKDHQDYSSAVEDLLTRIP